MPEFSQQKQPHPMRSDICNCNRKPTEPSMFGYRHIGLLNWNFHFCKQTLTADINNWPERYTVYVYIYVYAKILKDNAMLKHVQKGSTSTSSVDRLILEMFSSKVLLQHDLINRSCSPFFLPTPLFRVGWSWDVYGANPIRSSLGEASLQEWHDTWDEDEWLILIVIELKVNILNLYLNVNLLTFHLFQEKRWRLMRSICPPPFVHVLVPLLGNQQWLCYITLLPLLCNRSGC